MSDYTPTTEDVRDAYGWTGHDSQLGVNRAYKRREFDRPLTRTERRRR